MNDDDLERRALAAAAESQAKAEALREAEERKREEEKRRSRAKVEHEARLGAVRRLEEVLGHRTSPSDWGTWTGTTIFRHGGPFREVSYPTRTFATLKLMGVPIRGNEDYLEVYSFPDHTSFRAELWHELTLVSFGEALKRRKETGPAETLD